MHHRRGFSLLYLAWLIPAAPAAAQPASPPTLANMVPGEARVFIELGEPAVWLQDPHARAILALLERVFTAAQAGSTTRAASAPASAPTSMPAIGWRQQVAQAIGLQQAELIARLLTGRLALAADGWGRSFDAVLLTAPPDPSAIERALQPARLAAEGGIRRYHLAGDRELACDGRIVLVGRHGTDSLYARTLQLWRSDHDVSLADLADFRERRAALPAGAQLLVYVNAAARRRPGGVLKLDWWPAFWPPVASVAVSAGLLPEGLQIEASGRFAPGTRAWAVSRPPLTLLARLPISTLAAWTQPISYPQEFRRVDAAFSRGIVRFYIDLLQIGLPAGALERDLLAPLAETSLMVIGQVERPVTTSGPAEPPLLLPAAAVAVETREPAAAEQVLRRMSHNLLRLVNLPPGPAGPISMDEDPIGPDGGSIARIDLGRWFTPRTGCEFLRSLELSWTVADGWVVLGTNTELVRQIVQTRRGRAAALAEGSGPQEADLGEASVMLVAQPALAGEMIASWLDYLARHHPNLLQTDWWEQLRQRQRASSLQLGILCAPGGPGEVEVAQTFPDWPAHQRLEPGDRITAVDGQPLDPKDPQQSLRQLLANRKRPDRVTLAVIHADCQDNVELPMPPAATGLPRFQPVELLRQARELLRIFATARYAVWQPGPEEFNARLELQFAPAAP